VLVKLGGDLDTVRQQVIHVLAGYQGKEKTRAARAAAGSGKAGRGKRKLRAQLIGRLDSVESRLAALEQRVGTEPDVRDLDQEIKQVRRDKESAIDAEEFETAAVLRDKEKQLLAEKASRREEWAATHVQPSSLTDEIERLRGLLRQHGIEPQDGAA